MKIIIKKNSTEHENVSRREISYDVYENGKYTKTFEDVQDALDYTELRLTGGKK